MIPFTQSSANQPDARANGSSLQYRWLLLLVMIYLVGWTSSYPMIYRMTEVHHILEPGCIYLFPLSYAIADIVSEVYGYKIARQMVWFAMIAGFIFSSALWFVSKLPAPSFWQHQTEYQAVFSPILRAYFATTLASLTGNFINIYFISKWKILMKGRHFWLRSVSSTAVGEATFSVIGGTLAYWGVEPWSKIVFLMLDGYLFKVLYAFVAVWLAVLVVYALKKSEGVDVYDTGVNYSPFKLSLE